MRIITIRPIDTIQYPFRFRLAEQAAKGREGEHAARRDPEVGVPDGAEGALAGGPAVFCFANVDDAVELEGEHFAHVADYELDGGEGVEEAAVVEAEDVEAYFFVFGGVSVLGFGFLGWFFFGLLSFLCDKCTADDDDDDDDGIAKRRKRTMTPPPPQKGL